MKVFTKLMMVGRMQAVVLWVTERGNISVLKHTDTVELIYVEGRKIKTSVHKTPNLKHPEASLPSKAALIECQDLPFLEDADITGGHIQMAA